MGAFDNIYGQSKTLKGITDSVSALETLITKLQKAREEAEKLAKATQAVGRMMRGGSGGGSGGGGDLMDGARPNFPSGGGETNRGNVMGEGGAPGGGAGGAWPFKNPGGGYFAVNAGLAVGSFMYGALPSANDAVAQRIASQSLASYTGMSANAARDMTNDYGFKSGGMTGSYDMQLASAQFLYSGGYGINSTTQRNMMPQIGGISAMTGMSNPQAAAAMSGFNGMTGLSMGVNFRDGKGNLLDPSSIGDNIYKRLIGNRGITQAQADLVYNPNTASHQNLMTLAGGNQDTFNVLAEMYRMQAANGGKKIDLSNANEVMDKMGYAPDDPRRSMFNKNSSEAKLLQNTSGGLLAGYNAANNATAAVNNGMSALAQILPPVVNGLAALKGTLETLPGAGNAGSALSGLANSAMSAGAMYMGGASLKNFLATGGEAAAAGGGGGTSALSSGVAGIRALAAKNGGGLRGLARGASGELSATADLVRGGFGGQLFKEGAKDMFRVGKGLGSRAIPMIGSAISIGLAAKDGWDGDFSWGNLAMSAGGGAIAGGITGAGAMGIGAIPGALVGGLIGGAEYLGGWLLGKGANALFGNLDATAGTEGGNDLPSSSVPAGAVPTSSVVTSALSYVGKVPYVRGGKTTKGWDCSGFVQTMYAKIGVSLPRTAAEQAKAGTSLGKNLSKAQPGDLLFFHFGSGGNGVWIDHVAIYIGNGQMVEAAGTGKGTRISNVPMGNLQEIRRVAGGVVGGTYNNLTQGTGTSLLQSAGGGGMSYNSAASLDWKGVHGGEAASVESILNSGTNPMASNGLTPDSGSTTTGSGAVVAEQLPVNKVTSKNLIHLIYNAGFRGDGMRTAFGVAMAESSGNANATHQNDDKNKSIDRGLFQINSYWHPEVDVNRVFNAEYNTQEAFRISKHGANWKAWATFNSGSYKKYITAADKAISDEKLPSYDKGAYKIGSDQLAMVHKDEMVLPADVARAVRGEAGSGGGSKNVTVQVQLSISSATNEKDLRYMAGRLKDIWETGTTANTIGRT